MHATLPLLELTDFPAIKRGPLETLQVNLGYKCNQQCLHCHVNASPNRKELMNWETMEQLLAFMARTTISTLDLTGGAPELNPHFRELVMAARSMGVQVIDRCNLTILSEPGQEDLGAFLAQNQVTVVASMPCYLQENVDGQRGSGVFDRSVEGLRALNKRGYGATGSGLILNLVYNPQGPSLPPPQATLEMDYKKHLWENYEIQFNQLFTLANMPIQRFGSTLISKGTFSDYMSLLKHAFNDANMESLMCKSLVSVDWRGYVYDCDFNQMLGLTLGAVDTTPAHISNLETQHLIGKPLSIGDHCYGCTAGQGSSCGGALI